MAVAGTLEYLITIDSSKLTSGLRSAEEKVKKTGSAIGKIGSGIGGIAKGIGKLGLTAAKGFATIGGAAIGALAGITKSAVQAYANYEQLVGGVETLFGTGGRSLEEYQRKIGITSKSTQKQIDQSVQSYQNM